MLSKVTYKSSFKGIKFTFILFVLARLNHGKTFEACSLFVINTSSFSFSKSLKKPFTTIFKELVVPLVNTISFLLLALIHSFIISR